MPNFLKRKSVKCTVINSLAVLFNISLLDNQQDLVYIFACDEAHNNKK